MRILAAIEDPAVARKILDSLGLPSRPPPVAPARRSPQPKLTEFGRLTCRVRRPVLPGWIVSARFEDRRVQIHVRPEKIPFRMPPNTVLCGSATASAPTPLEKTAFDFPTLGRRLVRITGNLKRPLKQQKIPDALSKPSSGIYPQRPTVHGFEVRSKVTGRPPVDVVGMVLCPTKKRQMLSPVRRPLARSNLWATAD